MDHISASLLLFVSLCHWLMLELVNGILDQLTFGASAYLVLFPAILSGTLALLVKYLVAIRMLPVCKLVSGGLLMLLLSWYIDRICRNNTYLMVRFVGLTLIFCTVTGIVIVSEDGFADRRPRLEAEAVTVVNYSVAKD